MTSLASSLQSRYEKRQMPRKTVAVTESSVIRCSLVRDDYKLVCLLQPNRAARRTVIENNVIRSLSEVEEVAGRPKGRCLIDATHFHLIAAYVKETELG